MTDSLDLTPIMEKFGLPLEKVEFVADLVSKAVRVNEKTRSHANMHIRIDDLEVPLRIDDKQLLFVGLSLLPNIMNYLVNILPQLFYPYIVAYLQDLSDQDKPITINELFDLVKELIQS